MVKKKLTKKAFEEYLNQKYGVDTQKWGNGNYAARVKPYGTYLRSQDKEMFNIQYEEWLKEQG